MIWGHVYINKIYRTLCYPLRSLTNEWHLQPPGLWSARDSEQSEFSGEYDLGGFQALPAAEAHRRTRLIRLQRYGLNNFNISLLSYGLFLIVAYFLTQKKTF